MAEEGERVSVNDLNVAEKVSITGAAAPGAPEVKEKKEKPKKAPKEKKPVVHGGAAGGGLFLLIVFEAYFSFRAHWLFIAIRSTSSSDYFSLVVITLWKVSFDLGAQSRAFVSSTCFDVSICEFTSQERREEGDGTWTRVQEG